MSDFNPGNRVRVKKTAEVITIEDINDNPNYIADGEIYATGWGNRGSMSIDSPDEIEKIDWQAPTPEDLARALSIALHTREDNIEVHETSQEGGGLVAVLGRWKGVEGGFYVRFGTWQEDML